MIAKANPRGGGKAPRLISVGTKLAASMIALIVVVTAGVYVQLSRYQREQLLHAKEVAAAAVTQLFGDSCASAVVFDDADAVDKELTTLGRNGDVEYAGVWSVDAAGHVGRRLGTLVRGRPVLPTQAPDVIEVRRENDRVIVTSPMHDQEGKRVATAVLAFSLAGENRAIAGVEKSTLVVSVAVALGVLLLLLTVARMTIVGPLGKLVLAAKALEEGGSGDVDVNTNDEVGQLAGAFRSMAAAIGIRETRIRARNRDMRLVLDNAGQGFITLDSTGTMLDEHSRIIDEWFGPIQPSMKFWDYMRGIDKAAAEWFELGWEVVLDDNLPLDLCLEQLPVSISKGGHTFELVYRPVLEGDKLDKTIVVITDVTARVERERAEQAQRELMSIFRHVTADRDALDAFFSETADLVDAVLGGPDSDLSSMRRQIHTIKGNSGMFGIESVATLCHVLEQRISETGTAPAPSDKEALRVSWAAVVAMRAQVNDGGSDLVQLDDTEYAAFLGAVRAEVGHALLEAQILSWRFESASRRLGLVAEQIRVLGKRLGKAPIEVVVQPTTLRLPPSKWASFWSVFTHVIRNTADHGIETSAERAASGKSPRARVGLSIVVEGAELVVGVSDDGPGVGWAKLAKLAEQRGLPHETTADLQEAMFADGVSVRDDVTAISGRGVGLSAVRRAVHDMGGEIEIKSDSGRGTTFRFRLPISMLAAATVPESVTRGAGAGATMPSSGAADDNASSIRRSGAVPRTRTVA